MLIQEGRRAHHRIIVMSSKSNRGPCVPEMDTDVIAADLNNHMVATEPYIAVCLCCGTGAAETQVLRTLHDKYGHTFESEIFLDQVVSSALIQNLQSYVDDTKEACVPLPLIVTTFADLTCELAYQHKRKPKQRFLVFGIHASLRFQMDELDSFLEFISCCETLLSDSVLHPTSYTNYLHASGMPRQDAHLMKHLGSDVYAFSMSWREMASTAITYKEKALASTDTPSIHT